MYICHIHSSRFVYYNSIFIFSVLWRKNTHYLNFCVELDGIKDTSVWVRASMLVGVDHTENRCVHPISGSRHTIKE